MNKAFTLIELLIVIAIIGILASTVVIQLGGATDSAQDAKNKLQVSQVRPFGEFQKVANISAGYSNFCNDSEVIKVIKKISNNATLTAPVGQRNSTGFSARYSSDDLLIMTQLDVQRGGTAGRFSFKLTAYEGGNPDNAYYCADYRRFVGVYIDLKASKWNTFKI